jgi:hypothetical protein
MVGNRFGRLKESASLHGNTRLTLASSLAIAGTSRINLLLKNYSVLIPGLETLESPHDSVPPRWHGPFFRFLGLKPQAESDEAWDQSHNVRGLLRLSYATYNGCFRFALWSDRTGDVSTRYSVD